MRALQLLASALALGFVVASFRAADVLVVVGAKPRKLAITTHLGGPTVNFALIVTYSAAVYALIWIAFVHVQRSGVRIPPRYGVVADALFTVLLLSAGCAVAASDYVRYCHALGESVHCSSLKAAASFCFIAFVSFFISVGWGAWLTREQLLETKATVRAQQQQRRQPYVSGVGANDLDCDGQHQVDMLERSPSSNASNTYVNPTFVC
ncbi:hypothetical protein PybrP1_011809 [[Pythium] brassicae (nom. inval.)]|nr:hypothetical protein PybrP1_011809 [[Pythium] brassicae (nom. inval.)]